MRNENTNNGNKPKVKMHEQIVRYKNKIKCRTKKAKHNEN